MTLRDGLTPEERAIRRRALESIEENKARERLRMNKNKGRIHERQSAEIYREMGYHIEDLDRHTTGYDYKARKLPTMTGRVRERSKIVEAKSGQAELSRRQEEMQREMKGRYVVRRNPWR